MSVMSDQASCQWLPSSIELTIHSVKRSGNDESIRVEIHLSMEAMLGISLYSYPYLVFLIIA
jgi:hypothetical protein